MGETATVATPVPALTCLDNLCVNGNTSPTGVGDADLFGAPVGAVRGHPGRVYICHSPPCDVVPRLHLVCGLGDGVPSPLDGPAEYR